MGNKVRDKGILQESHLLAWQFVKVCGGNTGYTDRCGEGSWMEHKWHDTGDSAGFCVLSLLAKVRRKSICVVFRVFFNTTLSTLSNDSETNAVCRRMDSINYVFHICEAHAS